MARAVNEAHALCYTVYSFPACCARCYLRARVSYRFLRAVGGRARDSGHDIHDTTYHRNWAEGVEARQALMRILGRRARLALLEKQQIRQIYLMTLFARERNSGESVSPICFAAFKLMTNSNLVACCTGKSAGLVPFKILST
jgi:hypothetical protein